MKRMLFAAVMAVLAVCLVPSPASAQYCTPQSCDGLPGLPPQSPDPRSYDDFIIQTYIGAYGRFPTCGERAIEYNRLANAAANGTLHAEARRFVATRFMTQASYDVNDLTTYQQTAPYESRNPAGNQDRASLESFVRDLYRAFLQREPDQAGHCFWSNDACTMGRKHTIRAFEESIEFGNLVNGLFDSGAPECFIRPPYDPCGGGVC
jgi:Domain of unknown function (DUF4214)